MIVDPLNEGLKPINQYRVKEQEEKKEAIDIQLQKGGLLLHIDKYRDQENIIDIKEPGIEVFEKLCALLLIEVGTVVGIIEAFVYLFVFRQNSVFCGNRPVHHPVGCQK